MMIASSNGPYLTNERLVQVCNHLKQARLAQRNLYDVYILSASRTPTAKFGGAFRTLTAPQLGALAIRSVIAKSEIPVSKITHVYMGNVLSAGLGQSPARQASIFAGLPVEIDAVTINKVCASSLHAVVLAAQNIQLGFSSAEVAGGMESMSRVPYYIPRGTLASSMNTVQLQDGLKKDGLEDAYNQFSMGRCAENTATTYNLTREEQDEYAIQSYKRARQACNSGAFKDETTSVTVYTQDGNKIIDTDEGFLDVDFDRFPMLKPAFLTGGTLTAANSSTLNDGASAVLLVDSTLARQYGEKSRVLARICGYADAAVDPIDFAIAPAKAVPIALARAGISKEDVAVWEINEAFAAVVKANIKILGLENACVNPLGGAVSLGHALGSSGSRILVTLLHQLKAGEYGVAAICNGGGAATAMVVQRVSRVDEAGGV